VCACLGRFLTAFPAISLLPACSGLLPAGRLLAANGKATWYALMTRVIEETA
jgi:hypothetical protein